ncbi:MAG: hypothetical protein HC925_05110, partial [Coleofasciculaceae cyanobacterium SM2_3_26]|nr:hypothetical protein [Coleofasciculaceae cyanobacterium SM2_3_26]
IGGLSGGFLGWFWHKQDEPPKQEEKQEAEPEEQKEETTDRPKVLHTLMPGLSGDRAEPSTRQQPYRVERINRPSRRQLRKDRTVPLRRDR